MGDGVAVVLDVFDLREGQDKYSFMERMVKDHEVTHVLAICDRIYAEKADARKAGVGSESQIMSKEIYDKVEQSRFIPVIAEIGPDGEPFLPTFFKTRIWIDFSTPEAVNDNWEQLIRLLFGKPLHEKPALGHPPAYVTEDTSSPASPARGKYESLKQAILKEKPGLAMYRRDFLESCITFADMLRVRERPNLDTLPQKIVEDCGKLTMIRDHIVDWVLLESESLPSDDFSEALIDTLERLRALKSRTPEMSSWNDAWFDAHKLFVYETFLYIIAALLKTGAFSDLHNVFTSHFLLSETERQRGIYAFERFDSFYASSPILNAVLAPEGKQLYSPAAELTKRQANRSDVTFENIVEADLLTLLISLITPDTNWFPQTLYYSKFSRESAFFLRATQHKYFAKLAIITGVDSADALREAVKRGIARLGANQWQGFDCNRNFWQPMNMDGLDTIK